MHYITVDYEKELFAQYTPYLQWKFHKQNCRKQEGSVSGKHVFMLPFCSCLDNVEELVDCAAIDDEGVYVFAGKNGRLAEHAIDELAAVFAENPKVELAYADEDYLGTLEELYGISEKRFPNKVMSPYRDSETGLFWGKPWFKPDFSPDTLQSFFYIGNIFAVRGRSLKRVWNPQHSLYHLVVRIAGGSILEGHAGKGMEQIVHLPKVLFTNNDLAECEKQYGAREILPAWDWGSVLISIIIPSKDHAEVLGRCLYTLVKGTEYLNYEIIVVDNGSSDGQREQLEQLFDDIRSIKEGVALHYLYSIQPFNFSAMCNQGAQAAKGEYLLFLNDDTEIIHNDWLLWMLQMASAHHAGAVGAKLYYPKTEYQEGEGYKIQHVGITNMGIGPAHKLGGLVDKGNLYHGHNLANYNVIAVTAACLLVKRDKFVLVGGFDEGLAVAYNDVEFCFRLYKAGFYNILCNQAVLVHHESLSRGQDISPEQQKRLTSEKKMLYQKHPDMKGCDPFYSPNLVQWKKDVLYNTGYSYDYDKPVSPEFLSDEEVQRLPNTHKNKYIQKLTGESRSILMIDSVEDGDLDMENMLAVSGWYVLLDADNAQVKKVLLLRSVEKENIICWLPIYPKLRQDVADLFAVQDKGTTANTALAGIQVVFQRDILQKGRYEIGVYAKTWRGYLTWSGKYIEVY